MLRTEEVLKKHERATLETCRKEMPRRRRKLPTSLAAGCSGSLVTDVHLPGKHIPWQHMNRREDTPMSRVEGSGQLRTEFLGDVRFH